MDMDDFMAGKRPPAPPVDWRRTKAPDVKDDRVELREIGKKRKAAAKKGVVDAAIPEEEDVIGEDGRNQFGRKPKSERRPVAKAANEALGAGQYPTGKPRLSDNDFSRERARHAGLSLLTDEVSLAWHALTRKRRAKKQFHIADEAELNQAFLDYVESVSRRPFVERRPTKDGGTFCTEFELPVTQAGLCAFIGLSVSTWRNWKTETNGSYRGEEFVEEMEAIETKMFSLNLEKGLTGELAPNLMGKYLGIVDKSEVHHTGGGTSDRERAADLAIQRADDLLALPPPEGTRTRAAKAEIEDAGD